MGEGGGDHITNMGPILLGIWGPPRPHDTREMGPGGPIETETRDGRGGDHITNMGPIPLGIWGPPGPMSLGKWDRGDPFHY